VRTTGERWKNQLTQKKLSEQTGISQSLISDYETGRKKPSKESFLKICEALKISKVKIDRELAKLK